jgi:hypothetical protein
MQVPFNCIQWLLNSQPAAWPPGACLPASSLLSDVISPVAHTDITIHFQQTLFTEKLAAAAAAHRSAHAITDAMIIIIIIIPSSHSINSIGPAPHRTS